MNFSFDFPLRLWWLLLVPILIFIHFFTLRIRHKYALRFANFEAISRIKGIDLYSKNLVLLIITSLTLAVMVLAYAGTNLEVQSQTSPFSFTMVVDTSTSMEATDILPSRLEAAKKQADEFINEMPTGTTLGIISFAENPKILQSPTRDKDLLHQAVQKISLSESGGTDLYQATIAATDLLENQQKKAIILLTDGQTTTGDSDSAIEYANAHLTKVHTLALGTAQGGETRFGVSHLATDALQSLAEKTQGTYTLVSTEEDLSSAFKKIIDIKTGTAKISMDKWLIILSFILIILGYLLSNVRYGILP